MIEKSIMADFLFLVYGDGTMEMVHKTCRESMRTQKGNALSPINLSEAYEAAETHLLNSCPGS